MLAGTFLFMLFFCDVGAGPHHTVLVYPAPQFIVAVTLMAPGSLFTSPTVRVSALAVGALLVLSNLYLLSRYHAMARENGFSVYWTDASPALSRFLETQGRPTAFLDWGIRDVVRIETGDRVSVIADSDPREGVLYVSHCDKYVIQAEQAGQFDEAVRSRGLHRVSEKAIFDSRGAPLFCLFRLNK